MRKFVPTTDDSLGGMLIGDNKIVTATIIEGRKVVEILEATKEQLENILPLAATIIKQLREFFNSIFNRFPCVIKVGDIHYIFTEQKAPWKAIDKIFYMNSEDGNDKIMEFDATTMGAAKLQLFKALKERGYVK